MRYTIIVIARGFRVTFKIKYLIFNIMDYLTDIFHTSSHVKFDNFQDFCDHLSEYVYTKQESCQESCQESYQESYQDCFPEIQNIVLQIPECAKPKLYERFSPRKDDSLFWSIYIAKHGIKEFMNISRYHNVELDEKQKMITAVQKAPAKLKGTNIKVSNIAIQEILSDIMVNRRTQLQTIIAMSVFYEMEIYLVNESNCVYIRYTPQSFTETVVIYKVTNNTYSVYTGLEIDTIVSNIRDTMIPLLGVGNDAKQFRGISHYKVEDLEEIAKKINVNVVLDSGKKMKKSELYAKIVEKAVM